MNKLEGQVIVITGGCGDIGRGTASRLLSEGAKVVLLDVIPSEAGQKFVDALGCPASVRYVSCDITRRSEVDAFFATLSGVDTVISNAGIVRADTFLNIKESDWNETIAVNLTGSFHVAQSAARLMVRQKADAAGIRGRILFTGSWVQDMPFPGSGAYIASKGGLKMMAKVLAQECAPLGIRVNLVAPGLVMAGLTKQLYDSDPVFRERAAAAVPVGTFQSTESVAGCFSFLCSHESDYMTGATLLIDGGCSLVKRD